MTEPSPDDDYSDLHLHLDDTLEEALDRLPPEKLPDPVYDRYAVQTETDCGR